MKTLITILLVWLGLSVFASCLFMACAWWNSRNDPDDASDNDSKP